MTYVEKALAHQKELLAELSKLVIIKQNMDTSLMNREDLQKKLDVLSQCM